MVGGHSAAMVNRHSVLQCRERSQLARKEVIPVCPIQLAASAGLMRYSASSLLGQQPARRSDDRSTPATTANTIPGVGPRTRNLSPSSLPTVKSRELQRLMGFIRIAGVMSSSGPCGVHERPVTRIPVHNQKQTRYVWGFDRGTRLQGRLRHPNCPGKREANRSKDGVKSIR